MSTTSKRLPKRQVNGKTRNEIMAIFFLINVAGGQILFDKVKPIIWIKTKADVNLGVTEYDINYSYTSPCSLYERNIELDLRNNGNQTNPNVNLTNILNKFNVRCKALYVMEWQHEMDELLKLHGNNKITPDGISKPVPTPYQERNAKVETPHFRAKRSAATPLAIAGSLAHLWKATTNQGSVDPSVMDQIRTISLTMADIKKATADLLNKENMEMYLEITKIRKRLIRENPGNGSEEAIKEVMEKFHLPRIGGGISY